MRIKTSGFAFVLLMTIGRPSSAVAQAPDMEVLDVPAHVVWCHDVDTARGVEGEQYYAMLAGAVIAIDRALPDGSSTGTPFVSRGLNKTVPGKLKDDAPQEFVTVTVCAAVDARLTIAATSTNVVRETRPAEVVAAKGCEMAKAGECIDQLRTDVSAALAAAGQPATALDKLFWRSVLIKTQVANGSDITRSLVASDLRPVSVAPAFKLDGDTLAAAVLTRPIEQQVARPLVTKRLSWFEVIGSPQSKWVITALTLTDQLAVAIRR